MIIVFFRWIILSFILGVCYSTGYTALISSPRYTKPVDSLNDFIHNRNIFVYFFYHKLNLPQPELIWGIIYPNRVHFQELNSSQVPNYRKLLASAIDEKDVEQRNFNMANNDNYAVFVKVNYNRFVTDIAAIFNESIKLRLMKSCFYNQYTTLVMPKHSPYKDYVNHKIKGYIFGMWGQNITLH